MHETNVVFLFARKFEVLGSILLITTLITFACGAGEDDWRLPSEHNPVIPVYGLADPHCIRYEDKYYLYPTGGVRGYRVWISDDLIDWEKGPQVFSDPGPNVWAPDVWHDEERGKFYLYYTSNKNIGVAEADSPLGPFENKKQIVPGAIDAHLFKDPESGELYLYYSTLALTFPLATELRVIKMKSPTETEGNPKSLLQPEGWEAEVMGIMEGPFMLYRDGTYYLMYSGSVYYLPSYAMGYATADSPLGPFTKAKENPIGHTGGGVYGPGHHSVVTAPDGSLAIVHHQKATAKSRGDRYICVDRMRFTGDGRIELNLTPMTLEN